MDEYEPSFICAISHAKHKASIANDVMMALHHILGWCLQPLVCTIVGPNTKLLKMLAGHPAAVAR